VSAAPARLAAAALAVIVASACGAGAAAHPETAPAAQAAQAVNAAVTVRGQRVHGAAAAPDFALRDQHGRTIQLSALRGRIVVLTFLYTHCVDICPLIAVNVTSAVRSLGAGARDVAMVAVSVDPGHDTHAAVARFLSEEHLSPRFHYLTGPLSELKPVWQGYNLLIEPGTDGRVAHSAYVLVLDRRGRPRIYYPPSVSAPVLARDLRGMLAPGA
jgi:protein SCO1/2